jgi:tetrahydromethanopterin:alpha-L-glutamate ligase
MPPPDVVLLGAGGWHGARLEAALAGVGLAGLRLPFAGLAFAIGEAPSGIRMGALDGLPRAALVRFVPGGTLEQITLRLGLLHALAGCGVLVVNPATAIERCVDKAMASFRLAAAGVPTPPAWACERIEDARAVAARETAAGQALVLKPLFGAQGKGLRLIRGPEELPDAEAVAGVWYLQRFVGGESAWRDFRVLVIGGEPVAAMARHGLGWITNIRQGGRAEAVPATGELAGLAVAAAAAVGADYAGVDLIEDRAGRLLVLEVNSMPAWQGLQGVAEVDIAGRLAAWLKRRLAR